MQPQCDRGICNCIWVTTAHVVTRLDELTSREIVWTRATTSSPEYARNVVRAVVHGKRRSVRECVERRVLEIPLDPAAHGLRPRLGAARMVNSLRAMGHSMDSINELVGVDVRLHGVFDADRMTVEESVYRGCHRAMVFLRDVPGRLPEYLVERYREQGYRLPSYWDDKDINTHHEATEPADTDLVYLVDDDILAALQWYEDVCRGIHPKIALRRAGLDLEGLAASIALTPEDRLRQAYADSFPGRFLPSAPKPVRTVGQRPRRVVRPRPVPATRSTGGRLRSEGPSASI